VQEKRLERRSAIRILNFVDGHVEFVTSD
jgi:hypothetical protein